MIAAILLLALQTPADDRSKQITRALEWLGDRDPELREIGRKQLVSFGREAVPFLEQLLAEKGAAEIVAILREIEKAGPAADSRWVNKGDLPTDEEIGKELPKLEKTAVDKYVHARYAEALAFARRGNYQRGFDMVNALLVLEPRAAAAEHLRKLRRYCDNMILQTTLLEARVTQGSVGYVEGEPVELTLRLKNIFRNQLTLQYGTDDAKRPGVGVAAVEIEIRVPELNGSTINFTRSAEVRFEAEIPIATGAQWEKTFLLDTALQLDDAEHLRIFTVNAWTHPGKIEASGHPMTRRVQFEPAVVKVVPKKYAHFIENPLEWLGKTIDSGIAHETAICAELLNGEQREPGIEVLLRAMEKTENPLYRSAMGVILASLTGQRLGGDPKKWREWRQGPAPGKKAKSP